MIFSVSKLYPPISAKTRKPASPLRPSKSLTVSAITYFPSTACGRKPHMPHASLFLSPTASFVLPALDPSRHLHRGAHVQPGGQYRLLSPYNAGDIIGLPIRPVHCQEDVAYPAPQRRLAVDRSLTEEPLQADAVVVFAIRTFPVQKPDSWTNTESSRWLFLSSFLL